MESKFKQRDKVCHVNSPQIEMWIIEEIPDHYYRCYLHGRSKRSRSQKELVDIFHEDVLRLFEPPPRTITL